MAGFGEKSDIVVINEAGAFSAKVTERVGKGRSKARRTIEIESEPLLHDFDDYALGVKPSEAIGNAISLTIKGITEIASIATLRRRERAKRRMEGQLSQKQQSYRRRGAQYQGSYDRQYSGGRMGTMLPGQTVRLFNDSGRMAEGVFVRENKTDNSWTVNVPANRLDPQDFQPGRFDWMLNKLREKVPFLNDVRKLLTDPKVRTAINESINDMIMKGDSRSRAKLEALAKARKRAVLALIRGFQQALSGTG